MRASVHITKHSSRKRDYTDMALQGLLKLSGIEVEVRDINDAPDTGADFAVIWGSKHPANSICAGLGIPVLVLERPYFGNRAHAVSMGWNFLGRNAIRPAPGAETRPQPPLFPWRAVTSPGQIVVFDQVPTDIMFRDVARKNWAVRMLEAATKFWQRPGFVRPHPQVLRTQPIEKVLPFTWLGVTYNSTSGVDCVSHGVPVIATDPRSMVWDIAGHNIESIVTPDRREWAHWISYCQWYPHELLDGSALEYMLEAFDAAKESLN
jgi:hypothetical protein